MASDVPKCRQVFERWMQWHPDDTAWLAYARFELRHGNTTAATVVLQRYIADYPTTTAYIKFAKFAEFEAHDTALSRSIYEAAIRTLEPEEVKTARLFAQFAALEERQGEYARARVIYQHAIQLLHLSDQKDGTSGTKNEDNDEDDVTPPERERRRKLYQQYVTFEKKHGRPEAIERVIFQQHQAAYVQRLAQDPYDYDGWLEYAQLMQDQYEQQQQQQNTMSNSQPISSSHADKVRDVFERAVAQVPPDEENKDDWRRYIYVWIYYAVYEELQCRDLDRAVAVYETCLKVIPHRTFSFAKIWILLAQLLVRRHDLQSARTLLGKALGVCGKERIYTEYIALELALGEIDRCRALYTNYVKAMPDRCQAWCSFANLEQSVGETERCRAIYELAISQDTLDKPEMVWKAYIDWEIEEGDGARVRKLYERLLEKTGHVKVWISYAQFECTALGQGLSAAREVLETAYQQLRQAVGGSKEERVLLLDAWRVLEKTHGTAESVANVEAKLPRRIKRKRMRQDDDGNSLGWEEYFDYQYPDDVDSADATAGTQANAFKMLEMAARWKEQQQKGGDEEEDDSDDDNANESD
jgi:crooked neck